MSAVSPTASLAVLAALAALPAICSWLIAIIPSRKREASGITLGNPMEAAPRAPLVPVVSKPLVHLTRSMSGNDIEGYILGLRHLPLERTAPLLLRFVNGADPALQLYAQGILQQGRDKLSAQYHRLSNEPAHEPRTSAWLLGTGLLLAHPSLCSPTERTAMLKHLLVFANERLETAENTPALIANAAEVFLQAGMVERAAHLIAKLPEGSPLRAQMEPAIAFQLHQQSLA